MIIELIQYKYINLLLAGLLIKKIKRNTFICNNCGCECDIEDRVIDNCCGVCVSGLGYPHDLYFSDSDTLILRRCKK